MYSTRRFATKSAAGMVALCLLAMAPGALAGGPFGIDSVVPYDDSGIWARRNQQALLAAMIVATAGAAVWEGGETRLGRTLWQSVDAIVVGGVASEVLKLTFSRVRPSDTRDPNQWFKGGGNRSFPSGEVTVTSAIVTPLVLEFGRDHASAYALELLPIYDAIARVKVHGHWQSDVVAGFAIGTTAGVLLHGRTKTPWVLSVMPHGIYVGLKTH